MHLNVKMISLKIDSLDHVVFNVADAEKSLHFYGDTLGLEKVRTDEYRAGRAPFPSVRVNDTTIIDFFPPSYHGVEPGGNNVNHIALSVAGSPQQIETFLAERGITIVRRMTENFAARGIAHHAFHIADPDGNLLELHTYEHGN
ncbi:MAG: VOC family protein [Candidatus Eremiobacteraeota bacterium]|nr:VOC family protein [Candidatus Eremiobacteraeota bacterium]